MKSKPVFTEDPKPHPLINILNSLVPVFTALAAVLAVRLFLLLAITGAFILAEKTLSDTSGIWVLIAYCTFTILPLVWMDIHSKKGS